MCGDQLVNVTSADLQADRLFAFLLFASCLVGASSIITKFCWYAKLVSVINLYHNLIL